VNGFRAPVGPVFSDPIDVDVGADGVLYVLESGAAGRLRRLAPDETVTTLSLRSGESG
jgi:glucose/arabinose dehydrogenase